MKNRNLVIQFSQLPVREKDLNPGVLSKIFGGCIERAMQCYSSHGDPCCPGLSCKFATGSWNEYCR